MEKKEKIFLFFLVWISLNLLSNMLVNAISEQEGMGSFQEFTQKIINRTAQEKTNLYKGLNILVHLLTNLFSVLITVFIIYKEKWSFLQLNKRPKVREFSIGAGLVLLSIPIVSLLYALNYHIIPEGYISKDLLKMQAVLMEMNNYKDLIYNLLLLGAVAAIGEEFLYRGLLHRFLESFQINHLLIPVVGGGIFSLMHFQLEGFIPRFYMGALFSILVILYRSLWISIILHLFFNSTQVLYCWFYPQQNNFIHKANLAQLIFASVSLIILFLILYNLIKKNKHEFKN